MSNIFRKFKKYSLSDWAKLYYNKVKWDSVKRIHID